MKRLMRVLFLAGVLMAALCVTAMAANEATEAGIYDIQGANITVAGSPQTVTINGSQYTDFYPGAEKVTVTVSNTNSEQQLILALDDGTSIPTEGNIVYIDQKGDSGTITFEVYPSRLVSGKTYDIYCSSTSSGLAKLGSFKYYAPYKLGDIDGDGKIGTGDALSVLKMSVGKGTWTDIQRLAANVDGQSGITVGDALLVLRASVGKIQLS